MSRKACFIAATLLLVIGLSAFPQTIEEQAMANAANRFAIRDFEQAYSAINFVLKLYAGKETPANVTTLAESIYYAFMRDLLENEEYSTFDAVALNLADFPTVESSRIAQLITQSENLRVTELQIQAEQTVRQAEDDRQQSVREEESRLKLLELQQQQELNDQLIELKRLELSELAQRQGLLEQDLATRTQIAVEDRLRQQDFNQTMLAVVTANSERSPLGTGGIVAIAAGCAVVILGFILLIVLLVRSSHQQQQFFEYAVQQSHQPREIISIPMYTAPMADPSRMVEHRPDRKMLPAAEPDAETLKRLIERCREISAEIDRTTQRKNATSNVADLVFKVSVFEGYQEYECLLFLAVALVYDIGFLAMDSALFQLEKVTEEQFEHLKSHTQIGVDRIDFVPDEYKEVFRNGIMKHHENLDGSGYPAGLVADDIPYVARVIHAVESFTAMTSERSFREIRNKSDAIAVLMTETNKYDRNILAAIADIV